jgi:formate-dependent nitrite reductase cytochrome c552 subunit
MRRVLALLAASLALGAGAASVRVEPAIKGEQCIADTATMRRDHMRMLEHQRDETVHGGIRGKKASLKGCIDCHASKTTGSVAQAPTDFCVACHTYAAVKIDCFECHAAKPAAKVGAR